MKCNVPETKNTTTISSELSDLSNTIVIVLGDGYIFEELRFSLVPCFVTITCSIMKVYNASNRCRVQFSVLAQFFKRLIR